MNNNKLAYSIIYSAEDGISLGLYAGSEGFTSHVIIDGILGNLSIILWSKNFGNTHLINEESLVGDINHSDYDENIEELLKNLDELETIQLIDGTEVEHLKAINN